MRYLSREGLLPYLKDLRERHNSTGVELIDFAVLHSYVKKYKPQYFLECGTGLSTHIVAKAMHDYCKPLYKEIKLISMESVKEWYDHAMERFPYNYKDFLEIHHSEVDIFAYSFLRGTVYKEVPDHPFDTVFVDGPKYEDMCNMDFIRHISTSDKKCAAIIDSRKTTALAYMSMLGSDKIHTYHFGLSFVQPVSREDLLVYSSDQIKRNYHATIKEDRGSYILPLFRSLLLCLYPIKFDG